MVYKANNLTTRTQITDKATGNVVDGLVKLEIDIDGTTYNASGYANALFAFEKGNSVPPAGYAVPFYIDAGEAPVVANTNAKKVVLKYTVALLTAGVDASDDSAFEKYHTITLENVVIGTSSVNTDNQGQNITLTWGEGNASKGSLNDGKLGDDKTIKLYGNPGNGFVTTV